MQKFQFGFYLFKKLYTDYQIKTVRNSSKLLFQSTMDWKKTILKQIRETAIRSIIIFNQNYNSP